MDLRLYYQKVQELETAIGEAYPVVVSEETPDGGKAGTLTEVPAAVAAKMVVDGIARLAGKKEEESFRKARIQAKEVADATIEAAKVQLSVVPTALLNQLRSVAMPSKDAK
jgi:hypothetical protein